MTKADLTLSTPGLVAEETLPRSEKWNVENKASVVKARRAKRLKTYIVVMSCCDEWTNRVKIRTVAVKAHTLREARRIAFDLSRNAEPSLIEVMGGDGRDYLAPVEVVGVFPASRNDVPSRVWTAPELEVDDLDELIQGKPFSISTSAYHEAGHALVVYEQGWELTGVEVYEERRVQGDVSEGGICNYMLPFDADGEDEILVSLAGPVAESIYKGTEFSVAAMIGLGPRRNYLGGRGDCDYARAKAFEMHYDGGCAEIHEREQMVESYLAYMAQRVRLQYIDPNWNAIDRIANALTERKSLSGEEVIALIES